MKLNNNFTLEELCITYTGLDNIPDSYEIQKLKMLVNRVLQPARDLLGMPVIVNSGFRSPAVNKAVGGAAGSQHCKGEAADIHCQDNARLFNFIKENLDFDQLIWEFGNDQQPDWVHVSYKPSGNRKEVLRAIKENGKTKYKPHQTSKPPPTSPIRGGLRKNNS